ncbi:MAG: hypothetical protein Q8Q92_00005, partial [bacterium]|nr:hypothetical protein [bacterium]
IFRKKEIDLQQSNTLRFIDLETNNPTPNSLSKIKQRLTEESNLGFFDKKDAYTLYQRANESLGLNRISKDLYQAQTPEMVDLIREGILNGFYEQGGVAIDPDKKKSLLEIADRAKTNVEKKQEAQYIEATARNRVDTIAGVASGEVDLRTLDIAEIAEYDPQLGLTLTKAKDFMTNYNPKVPQEEQRVSMAGVLSPSELMKARSYSKSVSDVFMQNDNERLGEFVLRELEKKGDGTTSSVKLTAFTQLAALKMKANNPQGPEDNKAINRLNAIKSGVKFLESSNPLIAPEAISELIVRNFLSGASSEEAVMQEAKSVLKSKVLDRYKAVSKLSAVPNKAVEGEALVESLHSGQNEVEEYTGSYGDQSRSDY